MSCLFSFSLSKYIQSKSVIRENTYLNIYPKNSRHTVVKMKPGCKKTLLLLSVFFLLQYRYLSISLY